MSDLTPEEKQIIAEAVKVALASESTPKFSLSVAGLVAWVKENPTLVVVGFAVLTIVCKHAGIALPISYDDVLTLEAAAGATTLHYTVKNS